MLKFCQFKMADGRHIENRHHVHLHFKCVSHAKSRAITFDLQRTYSAKWRV